LAIAESKVQEELDAIPTEPVESAGMAGLRYVSNLTPGIRRKGAGRYFTYVDPDGERIGDAETLARVKALAIPPAWTDVWICPRANGHIQATGRDARGRKQYICQRHVDIDESTLTFQFRAKGGKLRRVTVQDRRVARIVKRMEDLPGQELF
jgi:DNA topoisomerase IB